MTTLDDVLDELRALRRLVEALQPRDTLTPVQRAVFAAVQDIYVVGEAFTSAEALSAAKFDREADDVLQRCCDGDPQRLGILLRQIADSGVVLDGVRLVRLPAEGGSRRWALEGTGPL